MTGGKLTTHVLDTVSGKPAAGIHIDLYRLEGDDRTKLKSTTTNDDGRVDQPLLADESLGRGTYELVFHVGHYFKIQSADLPNPAFLDEVPIRFGLSDPEAHYHVPLLVSPFSYATYRGS